MKNVIIILLFLCCKNSYSQTINVDSGYTVNTNEAITSINDIKIQLDKTLDKATTTQGSNEVIIYFINIAEKTLNQTYQLALSKCSVNFKPKLIASQRVWIAYKEDDKKLLNALYIESPGTMHTTTALYRVFEIIEERCKFLQYLVEERI